MTLSDSNEPIKTPWDAQLTYLGHFFIFCIFGNFRIFLKRWFSGFLGLSGLEVFHGTILVKNQYVQRRFRLLGARWGRVMTDFFFFSGPGTILPGETSPHGDDPPFPWGNPSQGPRTGKNFK